MKVKECYELEMPTPCEECGEVFDLNDGHRHPSRNIVICAECAEKLHQEADREEEIISLKEQITDAQWTIENALKSLEELGETMTNANEEMQVTIIDDRRQEHTFNAPLNYPLPQKGEAVTFVVDDHDDKDRYNMLSGKVVEIRRTYDFRESSAGPKRIEVKIYLGLR